ncbi:hypothetical protein [Basilea psittacipulmonis]|uniref:EamA domain-containing protein n=1 Tax=Basilea psittacipulmonis DSM 24701 TaxID=1072685 RepID=A0A077DFU3_9BURK|nr:hypothetical protein [Basilea psittacipulmonis]AIL33051.1 hypothetical protein IX83_06780 [Basilea psittacipulmonis DSM 24701]
MIYLILAVMCSVVVSVILKYSRITGGDIRQSILINYVIATLLSWFLLKPERLLQSETLTQLPWWLYILLGLLLPSVFIVMSKAVSCVGIARSDVAQRLSLFLTLIASFWIFNEAVSTLKIISVMVGLSALLCLLYKGSEKEIASKSRFFDSQAYYLFLVWIGYATIDILLKESSKLGGDLLSGLFISFVLGGIVLWGYLLMQKVRWDIKSLALGLVLGLFNFFNILFYIYAHQAYKNNPTIVFTIMNIGVIAVGSLVGMYGFKETLNRINLLGIALSILAVVMLFQFA